MLVCGEDHVIIDGVISSVAGADQQGLLVLLLQIQQPGSGPVQAVLGGDKIQVVGGVGLEGRICEE